MARRKKAQQRRQMRIMQNIVKDGALQKQLGLPEDEKIPSSVIDKILALSCGETIKIGDEKIEITPVIKRLARLEKIKV